MSFVDTFLDINITEAAQPTQASSTTLPLLLAVTDPQWDQDDVVHAYTSATDMLSDGFTSSSPEYQHALALMSGSNAPSQFLVGRRSGEATAAEAQEDTLSVSNVQANYVYKLTIGGTLYSYTSQLGDTQEAITTGLFTSINGDTNSYVKATIAADSKSIDLKAKVAGAAVSYTAIDANLKIQNVQQAEPASAETLTADDLDAINAQDSSWYCLVPVQCSDAELETIASWVLSLRKIAVGITKTRDAAKASVKDDVLSNIKAKSNNRAATILSPVNYALGLNAGIVGENIGATPGSRTWCYTKKSGFVADKFSGQELLTLLGNRNAGVYGKNGNAFHVPFGSEPVLQFGVMADGTPIDQTICLDWIYFQIQAGGYNLLTNNGGKIPYSDAGLQLIEGMLFGVLSEAATNGILDGTSISITVPKVSTVSTLLRSQRRAPAISFTARGLGAIESLTINGNVTY